MTARTSDGSLPPDLTDPGTELPTLAALFRWKPPVSDIDDNDPNLRDGMTLEEAHLVAEIQARLQDAKRAAPKKVFPPELVDATSREKVTV